MIAVAQRVCQAKVEIGGACVGAIGAGLVVLVCAEPKDGDEQVRRMAAKLLKLRVFADADGRMNLSVADIGGGLLVVSQFTLAADLRSGNRPGFGGAAPPAQGRELYDKLVMVLRSQHDDVQTGEFGASMQVHLVNDGPVTIPIHI